MTHSILLLLIFLLQSVNVHVVTASDATCGFVYGKPTPVACREAINNLYDRGDARTHFFGIPSVHNRPADITPTQWRCRLTLPVIVSGYDRDVPENKCIVGIFPIRLLDGDITYDIGRYSLLINDAVDIFGQCVHIGKGGHVNSGHRKRLATVLYEPGSDWDLNVRDALAAGDNPCLDEDESAVSLVRPTSTLNFTAGSAGTLGHSSLVAGS